MNDDQLKRYQLAVRERRQLLDLTYSRNGRAPAQAGLVALSRAVFLLATRLIRRPEWPGHHVDEATRLGWELEWYAHYLQALEELTPRLQSAVRDGKLTPRGTMTRAPLDLDLLRSWLDLDAKAAIAASAREFWADAEQGPDEAPRWADALVLPVGAFVTLDEFTAWAESEGIAAPGEVAALLRDPTDAPPPVFAELQEQPETACSGAPRVTPDEDTEQADVTTEPSEREILRKRMALIQELEKIWPSIQLDLSDAGRNGLSATARSVRHGFWKVGPALNWARENGKIAVHPAKLFVKSDGNSELSVLIGAMLNQETR